MFSDESMFRQFSDVNLFVCRLSGVSPTNVETLTICDGVGLFYAHGRGGLYFVPKGETMNAKKYIDALDQSLLTFMGIHGCTFFQQDSAPYHMAKSVK